MVGRCAAHCMMANGIITNRKFSMPYPTMLSTSLLGTQICSKNSGRRVVCCGQGSHCKPLSGLQEGLQSRFGDKPVEFQVVCPPKRDCGPNRLKGLIRIETKNSACVFLMEDFSFFLHQQYWYYLLFFWYNDDMSRLLPERGIAPLLQ